MKLNNKEKKLLNILLMFTDEFLAYWALDKAQEQGAVDDMLCSIETGSISTVEELIDYCSIEDRRTISEAIKQDNEKTEKRSGSFSGLFIQELQLSGEIPMSEYYATLPIVQSIWKAGGLVLTKPVTFFIGENGIGKSTIVEAIAVSAGFNPEGGTLNFVFSTKASHSTLHQYTKLIRGVERNEDGFFLRAESLYNAASYLDDMAEWAPSQNPFKAYGGKSLHEQSHGESFLAVVENRFSERGLYILDEPEAALSPMRQLRMMATIHELAQGGAQFIISTHSPILMALPNADVIQFTQAGFEHCSYRETEHYQVARDFLACPERMLKVLLGSH